MGAVPAESCLSPTRARSRRRRAWSWAVGGVAAALLVGCATPQRPVSRIVNGRVLITRSISPDAYAHAARSLLYEEEQRWDEAARELQRALSLDDGGAELRAHLAELFVRLGRLDDAAEQIQRSFQIAETVEGHVAAAHLAEARGDAKAALQHYRAGAAFALTDESPDAVERAHLALAEAELGAEDVEAALRTVSKLADVAPDSVRARVQQASMAWALGRLDVASTALDEALHLEPTDLDARLMHAALLVAMDRIPQAKASFRETLERADDPIEIAEMFLKWLVARGDRAEAAAEAERLTPDIVDEGTVETIIRIERAAGRREQALAAADKAVQKGVSPARVAVLAAAVLVDAKDNVAAATRLLRVSRSGASPATVSEFIESRLRAAEALREAPGGTHLDEAARALDEAAAAAGAGTAAARGAKAAAGARTAPAAGDGGPGAPAGERDWSGDLVVARALLEEKRGDAVRAARTLDAALEGDPDNQRLLLVRAAVEERRGDWRRALTFAGKILAADPRNVDALNFHGFVAAEHGHELAAAMRRLRVAIALNPGAGGVVDSLGWAYLHAGQLDRAQELLAQADRLEPGDPEILSHLAELYLKRQDRPRAIDLYKRALTRDPPERLARDIQARLVTLGARSAAER